MAEAAGPGRAGRLAEDLLLALVPAEERLPVTEGDGLRRFVARFPEDGEEVAELVESARRFPVPFRAAAQAGAAEEVRA